MLQRMAGAKVVGCEEDGSQRRAHEAMLYGGQEWSPIHNNVSSEASSQAASGKTFMSCLFVHVQ